MLHNGVMLNRTTYTGLSYLLAPLAVARLCYLSRQHRGYVNNIGQRFGFGQFAQSERKPLWLHAVSVGEVIASEPFVRQVLLAYPDLPICITTTTPTGAEQVRRSFADRVMHRSGPYDSPASINRFLDRLDPCGLVIMETELWPNWIAALSKRNLPSILINGRMSAKSERGYKKLGKLSKQMFAEISCISAQTEADAQRFRQLGGSQVRVSGNLKADFELSDEVRKQTKLIAKNLALTDPYRVIVAASTHKGEDEIIISAFKQLQSDDADLRLVLVPRHPNRTTDIQQLLKQHQLGSRLRSENSSLDNAHPVVVGDILGELRALYGLAKIAVIGGTLVNHGGHNPLEAAAWSAALIAGPSQRNFDLMFDLLQSEGAMLSVSPDSQSLLDGLASLLINQGRLDAMGNSAAAYLLKNRGATRANIEIFAQLFNG